MYNLWLWLKFVEDVDFVYRFIRIYDSNGGQFGRRWSWGQRHKWIVNENSIDAWFEGRVLNRYGTFDFICSENLKKAS